MNALEFATGALNLYELGTYQAYTGGMPHEVLTYLGWTYYGERTVSHTRLYEALGADCKIDKIVRIPDRVTVQVGWYVILEDGEQYRINALSPVIVASNVRATELTLVKVEDRYDIARDETV